MWPGTAVGAATGPWPPILRPAPDGNGPRCSPSSARPRLRAVVCQQLRDGWSPGSIAGRLPITYAADESCRVSHEAIYQWVYAQPVSTLAKELIRLRTARTARKAGQRPPSAPRIREPVAEQVAHRHLHSRCGEHGVDLVLEPGAQPDQLRSMPTMHCALRSATQDPSQTREA
jgi:IS30 family transposase